MAESLKQIDGQAAIAEKDIMEAAASMAWENDLSLWDAAGADLKENKELSQITKAMQRQTQGELQNITKTTGFRTGAGIEPVLEVYRRELDKAVVKLTSGAATQRQCVQDAVRELAQSGLRTIDYDSGRSYQIDTAVRMCVNTAAGQLAAQISNANILENDVTLVRVSEHWGARDKGTGVQNHKEWQGKVYSIDGKQHPEEEKRIRMEITDLQDATGYSVQESERCGGWSAWCELPTQSLRVV
ncbi:MAG: phage minor capsid protein [Gallintestinimicrobium sp.]